MDGGKFDQTDRNSRNISYLHSAKITAHKFANPTIPDLNMRSQITISELKEIITNLK
jgi:hypothetical protein